MEEVRTAAERLVGQADVLVALQDTSLARYGQGMIAVGEANRVPTYVSLGQLLTQGAVFSLCTDFAKLGTLSARQAIAILSGEKKAADLPVETDADFALLLNLTAARRVDMAVPVQVLKAASQIIR